MWKVSITSIILRNRNALHIYIYIYIYIHTYIHTHTHTHTYLLVRAHTHTHTQNCVLCVLKFYSPVPTHCGITRNLLSSYSLNVKIITYKIKMLSTDLYRMNMDRFFENRVLEIFWCNNRVTKLHIHVVVGASGTQKLEMHTTFGHVVISCGATKPPAQPEYEDGVSSQNVG